MDVMKWIPIIAAIVLFLYVMLIRAKASDPVQSVELLKSGALFIDVRTPAEFAEAPVPGSVNYPLSELEKHIENAKVEKDQAILLFCRSGRRSGIGMDKLTAMGYTNVVNVGAFNNAVKVAELSAAEASGDNPQ
jgi:rhodanese-related sulfurtransferase